MLIINNSTYTFSPELNIRPVQFEGVVGYNLSNVPFIGPELPNVPISKDSKMLNLLAAPPAATEGQANRLVYVPGSISAIKNGWVKQVLLGTDGNADTYDLSSHISFLGEKVASKIVWTKFMG